MIYIKEYRHVDPFGEEDWDEKDDRYVITCYDYDNLNISTVRKILIEFAAKKNRFSLVKKGNYYAAHIERVFVLLDNNGINYYNMDPSWKNIFNQLIKSLIGRRHITEFTIRFFNNKDAIDFLSECGFIVKNVRSSVFGS